MRITNGIIVANTIKNLNSALLNETKINQQIATNKKIQQASEDPLVATRAVTYRSYVSQVSQYQSSVSAAQGWQNETDDSLSSLADVITNLKELTTQAASSTSDRDSIKTEVETDLDQVTSLLNSDYVGSYIFGGYSTSKEPYDTVSTSIGDMVTYNGEYLSLGGVVSSDISDSDILSYYNANSSNIYSSLSDVTSSAYTAYQAAASAASASPSDTTLAAKATSAKTMYDTLSAAVSTYGGTANLNDAATAAKTTAETLATAAETYSGYTLSDAVTAAKNAYDTAKAASDASPADTSLAATATSAEATYSALNTAYTTTYSSSSTVTLATAADDAETRAETLAQAVQNTDENIKYNVGFSSEVTVNINGQDVTGQGSNNLFNTIQKLLLALDGDSSYKTVTLDSAGTASVTTVSLDISSLIDEFSDDLSRVTVQQSTLGARMDLVDAASARLDDASTTYKGLMQDNENIDTATASTELTNAEYTYEATLAVSSKVLGKSLIDYMS